MIHRVLFVVMLILTALMIWPRSWANDPDLLDQMGGHMEAQVDGKTVLLPTLKTDITADIQGDLASVTLVQTFANPVDRPLNATYLFPLNKVAAVYAMTMQTEDEIVEAEIHRKAEAEQKFEKAKQEGKAASLLRQHRPNMFTQDIANLMPGKEIRVTLKYVQTVPKVDGNYELVLPLVVGPRYVPGNMAAAEKPPAYPDVTGLTLPRSIEKERVALTVNLDGGMPIQNVFSKTHAITASELDENRRQIRFANGRVLDNRDFVLNYQLAGKQTRAGVLTHADKRGHFFSLLIEPPVNAPLGDITPREMVFVLDVSGSMSGMPIEASKLFMREALKNLRPTDYFRVVIFSNNAGELSAQPLKATPDNIRRGLDYVNRLHAGGGTEIVTGINQTFNHPPLPGTKRLVVFLTDGYIGNETEVLALINRKRGESRLYAFGVGTAVNRYLLSEMARFGRGFVRYIDPTEAPEAAAKDLAKRLESPILTDIEIDWGGMQVADVSPDVVPDLFLGDSIRIQGKVLNPGNHTITVNGLINGRKASLPLVVNTGKVQSPKSKNTEAIALVWARSKIADLMRQWQASSITGNAGMQEGLKETITRLGLEYSLMTRWTAFVAVSKKIVNPNPNSAADANVSLSMVKGVTANAYGTHENFHGAATPEPHEWLMILLLVLAGVYEYRRRTRQTACLETAGHE